ncbi:Na+/H+ antiporter subunit A [Nonomuraea sp. NPDC050328]|uniref:Na+/H+ antiporter subunit A n=1 Tax=Nonomuraea sp. NPDC050328 TaxID=3364361 RepID=UPI0037B2D6F0
MEVMLVVHAVAALAAPALAHRWGRNGLYLLALAPAAGFVHTLWTGARTSSHDWAPALGLSLSFRADALTLLLMYLVTGVGALVLIYSARYLDADDRGAGRFGAFLVAFAGAMYGLVAADDLLLLYVFWELTTVFSYLLIGYQADRRPSRSAAIQALTVTGSGGLVMLAGLIVLGQQAGTYRLSLLLADPPSGTAVTVGVCLVLVGALAKSAIWPFSLWLPGAMAAPTPVSAYLHAAAMVKAGVYLLARLDPAFGSLPAWKLTAMGLGGLTMLMAGWRALRETDLKLVLAYGTVSQLGFLFVLFGAGIVGGAIAGAGMLLAHALFKSALFLVVGIVDHATGTRDLRELSGLGRRMPWIRAAAVLAAASMAGLPPFLGFAGKEAALAALLGWPVPLAVVVLGSMLTAGYSLRFLWGAFAAKPGLEPTPLHATPASMAAPACLLAVLGLAGGPFAVAYGEAMAPYFTTFRGTAGEAHLTAWSGFTLPLALSALALAGGVVLFLARDLVARAGTAISLPDANEVYWGLLGRVNSFALQLTGIVQRGSLPDYLLGTLLALVAIGAFSLLYGTDQGLRVDVILWQRPERVGVALLLVAVAVTTLWMRSYLGLAIVAGLTGYGVVLLFLSYGAPDLALTQVLCETVSLVVFVLVLRRLPRTPEHDRRRMRLGFRLAVGLATAAVVVCAGVLAAGARVTTPVSALVKGAVDEGNLVTTLLVNIRAWDTMGESSVLLALTLGVTSMIFVRSRTETIKPVLTEAPRGWLVTPEPPDRQWAVLAISARLLFHLILLFSVFLVFNGENSVGGGFAGGIVAGLALTLRYFAGGGLELEVSLPVGAGILIGVGLLLSTAAALIGLVVTGSPLTVLSTHPHVPWLGELHLSTELLFDLGVYILVLGVIRDVLRAVGTELDRQIKEPAR